MVADVDTNIRLLKESKQEKLDRLAYYKGMMIEDTRGKQETTAGGSTKGASSETGTASALQLSSLPQTGRGRVQVQS